MITWLAIGAAVSLVWGGSASAHLKGPTAPKPHALASIRAPDLRIPSELPSAVQQPLRAGTLVSRDVGANATLALGFARISAGGRSITDLRISGAHRGSRKPSLSFVLRF